MSLYGDLRKRHLHLELYLPRDVDDASSPMDQMDDATEAAMQDAILSHPAVFIDATGVDLGEGHLPMAGREEALPPFESAWVEWRDQKGPSESLATVGVLVRSLATAKPRTVYHSPIDFHSRFGGSSLLGDVLEMCTVLLSPSHPSPILAGVNYLPLTRHGSTIPADTVDDELRTQAVGALNSILRAYEKQNKSAPPRVSGAHLALGLSAFPEDHSAFCEVAVGLYDLLNCSNIAVEPTVASKPKFALKHEKKHGLTWHRLVVVKPSTVKKGAGKIVPYRTGDPLTRAHIRRGHKQSYGPDAPLFGKYVGTWWWHPCVAGSRKVGVVLKDYEVIGGKA